MEPQIGTIQIGLTWPLCKDDTHKSRTVLETVLRTVLGTVLKTVLGTVLWGRYSGRCDS
jgi:hypothetical protein